MPKLSRRQAIQSAALFMGGARMQALINPTPKDFMRRPIVPKAVTKNEICVFTKPFNSLSFDRLAEEISNAGFDGIEAPIRKGGHIEPEQVEVELPKLVDALAKKSLKISVLTSDINDPRDPLTEKVLKTASSLGIKRYRMKYFRYDLGRSITKQLENWRKQFQELAAVNRELNVIGLYQNHAGSRNLGSPIWDLHYVLDGISKTDIGVAYDIRHATVEGGQSWPISFELIKSHIDTIYVKDFRWQEKKPINVPLGDGNIPTKFFKLLSDLQYDGPVSLHEEYLDHKDPELVPQHLVAMKNDLAVLRRYLPSQN